MNTRKVAFGRALVTLTLLVFSCRLESTEACIKCCKLNCTDPPTSTPVPTTLSPIIKYLENRQYPFITGYMSEDQANNKIPEYKEEPEAQTMKTYVLQKIIKSTFTPSEKSFLRAIIKSRNDNIASINQTPHPAPSYRLVQHQMGCPCGAFIDCNNGCICGFL